MENRKQEARPLGMIAQGIVKRSQTNIAMGLNVNNQPSENYSVKTTLELSREKKKKWGTHGSKGPKYCRFKLQVKWRYPFQKNGMDKKSIFPSFDYEEGRNNGQVIRIYSEQTGLKKLTNWVANLKHEEYHEAKIFCNMTNNLLSHLKNYKNLVYIIRGGEIVFQGLCPRWLPNGKLNLAETYLATEDFNAKKELARQAQERAMVFSNNNTQLLPQ